MYRVAIIQLKFLFTTHQESKQTTFFEVFVQI